jgi:1-deoxy-D-xylulose-5-phosphate reductoisomerase
MTAISVSLIGSTGSIGTQAVDVISANPERFRVVALGAQRSVERLAQQASLLHPEVVAIGDGTLAADLAARIPAGIEVLAGSDALVTAAGLGAVTLNGVVGFAGLPVTLAALESGHRLALANKESLIAGAPVVQRVRQTPGASIVPVDSEHCAIHQCLSALGAGGADPALARLWITASGGPFRGLTKSQLAQVSLSEALAHPTWQMGPKITIDSSTLMNKGLEVIEAHELFGVGFDRIDVVVHPQSVVHSMIELTDGSSIAQLSRPDMRLPIGYAMGWPERLDTPFGALNWSAPLSLSFEPPDREVFSCLDLAYRAGSLGGSAPAWLNAANEIAVDAFLGGQLSWLDIAHVVEDTLEAWDALPLVVVEDVLEADRRAREVARQAVARRPVSV